MDEVTRTRSDVLFVKLDRNEHEVVALPGRVRVVSESVIDRDPMQTPTT